MEDIRPRIETVVESYDTMLDEMRAALTAEFPASHWSSARNALVVPATTIAGAPTAVIGLSAMWSFGAALSRSIDLRDRASAVLSRVGARYGFGPLAITEETFGGFQAIATDEYGAHYEFGGVVHFTLTYTTGAHLQRSEADAQRHRLAS